MVNMLRMIDRQSPGWYAWLLIALTGCAGARARDVADHREPAPQREFVSRDAQQISVHELADDGDLAEGIQLVSEETSGTPDTGAGVSAPTATLSLAAILQLAESQNPNIALAQERIQEAYARVDRADALWLPSIRAGINYNHHEGRIQDVAGNIINTNRSSLYGGFGANAVGAGSPAVPGLIANFHLVDAIYQPRIAEHQASSRQFAAAAARNDVLRDASIAYLELLRAEQGTAIAREALDNTQKLAELTRHYAESGQGLQADHQRMQAELALREEQLAAQIEAQQVASARLAQLLHADASVVIVSTESTVVPLEVMTLDGSSSEFVAMGLSRRPELCEHRHLVCEAVERWNREKYAPLVPSVLLGLSYGGLGGGLGSTISNTGDRWDADAVAYWELRNLGAGDKAAQCEAASSSRQAQLRQVAMLDRVAREISEAHAQVIQRQKRIRLAQSGITAAEKSYDLNQQRIENAQGLPIETLQAIQALATARRAYLNAVVDYNIAQFELCRATGWFIGSSEPRD
jgi:outer membrane protein TolC